MSFLTSLFMVLSLSFVVVGVSPDSPDSPDCQIAQKRKVRWTWICQSSETGESVKRAFRPGLSLKYLTSIAPPPPFLRSEKGENKNGIGRFRKKFSSFRPMFSGVRREKRTFFQRWHFYRIPNLFLRLLAPSLRLNIIDQPQRGHKAGTEKEGCISGLAPCR